MTFFGDNDNELYVKGCHPDLGVVCCEHDYTYSTTDIKLLPSEWRG